MKQGTPIDQIAQRVMSERKLKQDFLVNTRSLRMLPDSSIQLSPSGRMQAQEYKPTDVFHRQVADKLKIPISYYRRMMETDSLLLSQNVNVWLHSSPTTKCFRTFKTGMRTESGRMYEPTARAFLGNHYNPMDNYDLLENILPRLEGKGCILKSCQITESRLYIHAVFPQIEGEIKNGDVVQAGLQIRNSEVGMGSLQVNPWIYRLVCKNGMKVADAGVRRYHAGKNLVKDNDVDSQLFRDSTRKATDRAFWMQVVDIVDNVLDEVKFNYVLDAYRERAGIEVNPVEAVTEVTKRYDLTEGESGSVLQHLAGGGDLSVWGLANAVTSQAHEAEYERAVELEQIGGEVVALPVETWMQN